VVDEVGTVPRQVGSYGLEIEIWRKFLIIPMDKMDGCLQWSARLWWCFNGGEARGGTREAVLGKISNNAHD